MKRSPGQQELVRYRGEMGPGCGKHNDYAALSQHQPGLHLSAAGLFAGGWEGSKAMKVAITGGTGFVGRNIARLLAAEGHQLLLIARGSDWTEPSARSIGHFISLDLNSSAELANAMVGCDAVVHCA